VDYLNLVSDRRPLDLQALLAGGFFSPSPQDAPAADPREVERILDQFSLQTGTDERELSRVLEQMLRDPKLLEQLNQIREQQGLPPLEPGQRPGQALGDLNANELMALLVMWALQQENNRPTSPPRSVGRLPQSSYSNVRPTNWGGGGGGGGGGGNGGGGGSTSSTGGGGSRPTAIPGGPVPGLPGNLGPVTPGQNGVPAGLRPNAARGAAVVREVFGFDGTIGGIGQRSGPSDHPHGNAIDVMTMQNMQQGQQIADFMVKHAEELGVKYVIFNQRIASPSNGWQWTMMEDRGSPTQNHMDHVHVSFH
jgi:hypothetical protein